MIKLGKFLTKNLRLKISSIIVAIILWFVVLNVTDPTVIDKVSVPLRISGSNTMLQDNYILLNEADLKQINIDFRIQSSTSNIAKIKNSSLITAYIDLSPIDIFSSSQLGKSQPIRVKYEVANVNNYTVLSINPQEVNIVMDRVITKDMKISINKKGGDMEGYVSLTPVASPDRIQVTGPKSVLDTVATVEVDVDTDKAVESIVEKHKLKVTNSLGKDMTSRVKMSQDDVEITVQVQKYAHIQVEPPEIIGTPAAGYKITSVEVSPENIEVVGVEADINKLKTLTLDSIDVTGWTQSQSTSSDMRLQLMETGLEINVKNGTTSEVKTKINIEREVVKNLRVPLSEIEVIGGTEGVEFPKPYADILIRGLGKDLAGVNGKVLKSKLDITDLGPGTHDVTVEMEFVEEILLIGELAKMQVIIGDETSTEENATEPSEQALEQEEAVITYESGA